MKQTAFYISARCVFVIVICKPTQTRRKRSNNYVNVNEFVTHCLYVKFTVKPIKYKQLRIKNRRCSHKEINLVNTEFYFK